MPISNDVLESQIESLRFLLRSPDLQLFARSEWGSNNPEYRNFIKAALQEVNVDSYLQHSISHTHELGAIALSSSAIGVDVELSARVTEAPVARVSSREEVKAAPSPVSLWCAKEAAFKALKSYDQPSVLSKISIGEWQKIDSQTETFRLINASAFNAPSEGRGVIKHLSAHTLGFFIFCS
ncbi:4'-phosphopantetheinyl transferase superfamily protein [Bdellovibrio svalbardensis]|uniref:4'-phosphopantetheinyl transferase superfamily protein n=1 Tax=Bdellovibrio svalbardensis TaxID=2972972 RepID=A0ABT6DE42_9BACT|nr:4'-phosphopantetheinyl transferase superfamily protein [Bdellovibrio svalbardensis]MDG0815110.1 4'-phosphopantetheinyl transferase superfamily protein [Bdellovibrio svalbardensis]